MQLYVGTSQQFVLDSVQNQLTERLTRAFFDYYGRRPQPPEVASWTNSLRAMAQVIGYAELKDNGVLLEYQLPLSSKRIDCILAGRDAARTDRAVVVELKQWERCAPSDGEYVVTWVAGGHRDVLHPSVQSDRYCEYLRDSHTAFYEEAGITLDGCAYLHNYAYAPDDPLLEEKYAQVRKRAPVFSRNDVPDLSDFLSVRVGQGEGNPILNRLMKNTYRPSKRLMDHVGGVIKGNHSYVLMDEQLVVYDKLFTLLRKGVHNAKKQVLIVKGGPGTGKSVIALNLMADLLQKGHSTHYVTGSKAFTETLRKIVGSRGGQLFRYFNSYADADPASIDVLVMDEAHRIRATSNSMYTPKAKRSDVPQVRELLNACKVAVLFLDDLQVVRPNEIGSAAYIRAEAEVAGAQVHEFELDIQFRCGGSDAFLQWVDNTLAIRKSAQVLWEPTENFDFRIMDSPEALDAEIRAKVASGRTARLVAGFCWPWSDPRPDGTLENDVVIGGFSRPWNAKPDATRLAPGIPKASLWAYDPRGIDQIGCIYTAQGFEFDYVGVIIGRDLLYDPRAADWRGNPATSEDTVVKRSREAFPALVKNAYRVLLSRGLKGCFVYCEDEATANFVRSRIARPS